MIMKRIGDYSGYPVDLVSQKEYDTKCQYQENVIFAVKEPGTIRASMYLNGSYVGLLNWQNLKVLSYDDSKAPSEWKEPRGPKMMMAVEEPSVLSKDLDARYKEVLAEFERIMVHCVSSAEKAGSE